MLVIFYRLGKMTFPLKFYCSLLKFTNDHSIVKTEHLYFSYWSFHKRVFVMVLPVAPDFVNALLLCTITCIQGAIISECVAIAKRLRIKRFWLIMSSWQHISRMINRPSVGIEPKLFRINSIDIRICLCLLEELLLTQFGPIQRQDTMKDR